MAPEFHISYGHIIPSYFVYLSMLKTEMDDQKNTKLHESFFRTQYK